MHIKTIDIDESAYEKLLILKREDETFSDLINRLVRNHTANFSDFAGILSNKTVNSIKEMRKARKK